MSQGGFCLWKHSAYRLAICLAESPQPRDLAPSHLNKYLTKMKDYFTSCWKEQEPLLFTPESEYFLFLECLCKNPCAAACLELVGGCEGVSWGYPSGLPATLLLMLGSCGCGRALAMGMVFFFFFLILCLPGHTLKPRRDRNPPHPKETRKGSHKHSKGDVTHQ